MQQLIGSSASEGGGRHCEDEGSINSPRAGGSGRVKQGRRLCALVLGAVALSYLSGGYRGFSWKCLSS